MTDLNINWKKEENVRNVEGKSLVFHCHHYNCFLQKTIEGPQSVKGKEILTDVAREVGFEQMSKAFNDHTELKTPEEKLGFATEFFKIAGFGIIDFSKIHAKGGVVTTPTSHYSRGWLSKWGTRATPGCHFNTGWMAGVLAAAYKKDMNHYNSIETKCESMTGNSGCEYRIEVK